MNIIYILSTIILQTQSTYTVEISWDPVTKDTLGNDIIISGYNIYWVDHIANTLEDFGAYKSTSISNSFNIIDLQEGIVYYVAVTAYDLYGNESGLSNIVQVIMPIPDPPAIINPFMRPTGLIGTIIDANSIHLTWNEVTKDSIGLNPAYPDGYRIYVSTDYAVQIYPSQYFGVYNMSVVATEAIVVGLTPDTLHYFAVTAYNETNESAFSDIFQIKLPPIIKIINPMYDFKVYKK